MEILVLALLGIQQDLMVMAIIMTDMDHHSGILGITSTLIIVMDMLIKIASIPRLTRGMQ